MGLFDKKSETKATSTTTVPDYVNDASEQLVNKASKLAKKPYEPYTGDRTADFSADQKNAFQMLRDLIAGAPEVLPEALQGARNYAAAPAQNISTERVVDEGGRLGAIGDYFNPYVDEALQPALRKIMDAADEARKRIGGMATSAGAYGDARHGILERGLQEDTAQAIGDTSSKFFMDAFDRAMGLRGSDLNRFEATDAANANFNETALGRELTGSGDLIERSTADQARKLQQLASLLQIGGQQQGLEQADLDAAYQEFLRGYQHDFNVLDALSAALSGSRFDTTSTTTQTAPDNSAWGALGSAAGSLLGTEAMGSAIAAMI